MVERNEIDAFLYREARLMDSHAYEDWLALWDEEASYFVPCNDDDIDTGRHVSLVDDNRRNLEDRIARLTGGACYAQDPPTRLCRVVSNVEIEGEVEGVVTVHSTFNLTAVRRGRKDVFSGRNLHRLVRKDGGFLMSSKRVVLVDNDEVLNNLTFLI